MRNSFYKIWYVIALCVVLCTFTNCSSDQIETEPGFLCEGDNLSLQITATQLEDVPEAEGTRGQPLSTAYLTNIGLFGLRYTGSDYSTTAPSSYIHNIEVREDNDWNTGYSWPGASNTIALFAYAPYEAEGLNVSTASYQGAPLLSYVLPEDAAKAEDIVVGQNTGIAGNYKKVVPIHLEKHLCAKVVVCVGDAMPSGVASITFKNVFTEASYRFGDSGFTLLNNHQGNVTASDITITGTSGEELTTGTATFMMIPQTLDDASIEIEYDEGTVLTKSISGTWVGGETYVYNINCIFEEFDYTGGVVEWECKQAGTYRLEVWGAQGGAGYSTYTGGLGGYATGVVSLSVGDKYYINIGGAGRDRNGSTGGAGGYNGGGKGGNGYGSYVAGGGGGGATHIATVDYGLLSNYATHKDDLILVGGGGGGFGWTVVGDGGGLTGGGSTAMNGAVITGGGQSADGIHSFGQGGAGRNGTSRASNGGEGNGGGGGGYYGGQAYTATGNRTNCSGAGGSSYLNPSLLKAKTLSGKRSGNGKARIILLDE